jgi:uncharacterized protein YlaI
MVRPAKGKPKIKQAVIELTPQHSNFADFQITQTICERFAIRIAGATINRLCHLGHFNFLSPKCCQKLAEVER